MHKSRIFTLLLFSFLCGVFARSFFQILQVGILISLLFALVIIQFGWLTRSRFNNRRANPLVISGFCIVVALAGVVRYQADDNFAQSAPIRNYSTGGQVIIRGLIIDDPKQGSSSTQIIVESKKVMIADKKIDISGNVLVFAKPYPEYTYGDEVEISGKLVAPQMIKDFDYPSYLEASNIYALMSYPKITVLSGDHGNGVYKQLFRIKHSFEEHISRIIPEPEASFLTGLLVGSKSKIPQDIIDAFKNTGTTHIIALSGFNITIIADSFQRLLQVLTVGAGASFWLTASGIILFTMMVGGSASIIRAAIMGLLVLIARREGREYQAQNALLFAAACMVFLQPKILRFDVGFQLSFLATCGLLFLSPILQRWFKVLPNILAFRDNLATTLAAQIFVLPILLSNFGTLSLISPVVNILVLSVVPLTMLVGFIAVVLSFFVYPLGMVVGGIAYGLLWYQLSIIEFFAKVPFASISMGNISNGLIAMYYAGLGWFIYKNVWFQTKKMSQVGRMVEEVGEIDK